MTDLIKRLEEAEAGSRELDREIAKLIDKAEWAKCANWASMPCGASPDAIDRDALRWLPGYTTSLDAAVALAERVLPGWGFYLRSDRDGHSAGLTYPDYHRVTPGHVDHKGSLPLALCAAILKATDTGRE